MTLPKCRLFLVAPASGNADLLADCFAAAVAAGDVASLLITDPGEPGLMQQTAKRLLPLAHAGDTAVLIENDHKLAKALGADGLEIDADIKALKDHRAAAGTDLAIGVNCGDDRHLAMEMAEAGADYIRISPFAPGPGDEPLITWWSQLFEIPSVTEEALTCEQITEAARLGADFVRPGDDMWTSAERATEIITKAMSAIEAARR
jgi:thiamine-phosphate pyrophosphorylase